MKKAIIPLILLLITATVFTSGCETKTANQTWGEQKINIDLIKISNNTTAYHYDWEGVAYYYVEGYIINKNPIDAINVNLKANFYDSQGNIIASNDTPYLEPKNIPSNSESYFYFEFLDPDKKIVNYTIEVLDAKSTY